MPLSKLGTTLFSVLSLIGTLAVPISVAAQKAPEMKVPPDQRIIFVDPKITDSRSGYTGMVQRLEARNEYQFLVGLYVWEHKDSPCKVMVRFFHANQGTHTEQEWQDENCKSPGSERGISISAVGLNEFFTGMRVCHPFNPQSTLKETRVKGIKGTSAVLNRATLIANPPVAYRPGSGVSVAVPDTAIDGFERTRCSTWWPDMAHCEPNRVATGVAIDTMSGNFAGLRLICAAIRPKKSD